MNIFEGAKFGDIFTTKDGTKNSFCSFTKIGSDTLARLYREGWGAVIFYLDGQVHSGVEFGKGIDFTIIGKESINEEELDRLAKQEGLHLVGLNGLNLLTQRNKYHADLHNVYELMEKMYKAGYRKAKGE